LLFYFAYFLLVLIASNLYMKIFQYKAFYLFFIVFIMSVEEY